MPEKKTLKKASKAKKEGKAPSTQAGEFIREEMHHIREGKHGARSSKQAVAIGLSKARRAGIDLKPPKKGKVSEKSRKNAQSAYEKGQKKEPISKMRSAARKKALKKEPREAASKTALSRQTRSAAKRKSASQRTLAAKKAVATKGPSRRSLTAKKAAASKGTRKPPLATKKKVMKRSPRKRSLAKRTTRTRTHL